MSFWSGQTKLSVRYGCPYKVGVLRGVMGGIRDCLGKREICSKVWVCGHCRHGRGEGEGQEAPSSKQPR